MSGPPLRQPSTAKWRVTVHPSRFGSYLFVTHGASKVGEVLFVWGPTSRGVRRARQIVERAERREREQQPPIIVES